MSQMQELFMKVSQDTALQEKFSAIIHEAKEAGAEATEAKLTAFAKEAGYAVTLEEMAAFFGTLSNKNESELSETELDMVAGGKGGTNIFTQFYSEIKSDFGKFERDPAGFLKHKLF